MKIAIKILTIIALCLLIRMIHKDTSVKLDKEQSNISRLESTFQTTRNPAIQKEIQHAQSRAGGLTILPTIGIVLLMATTFILILTFSNRSRKH